MINGLGVTCRQIFLQCPVQQHLRRTWGWRWESWWLRLVVCVSAAFPSRWATKGRFPSWVHIQGESPPWNSVFREGLGFQEMMSLLAMWGEFLGWCRMVLHVLLWAKFVQLGGLTPFCKSSRSLQWAPQTPQVNTRSDLCRVVVKAGFSSGMETVEVKWPPSTVK